MEQTEKTVTKEIESQSSITTPENNHPSLNKNSFWKNVLAVWLSRKLWATLISFFLIWFSHEKTINHLYTLTEAHQATALTTIYVATLSVLGVIVGAFLGTSAIQSKFGISGAAQLISQSISEKREEKIDTTEDVNIKEDRTIHTIEEVTKNINLDEHVVEEGVNNDGYARPYSQFTEE